MATDQQQRHIYIVSLELGSEITYFIPALLLESISSAAFVSFTTYLRGMLRTAGESRYGIWRNIGHLKPNLSYLWESRDDFSHS